MANIFSTMQAISLMAYFSEGKWQPFGALKQAFLNNF